MKKLACVFTVLAAIFVMAYADDFDIDIVFKEPEYANNGTFKDNPFPVKVTVKNTSSTTCNNVNVTLLIIPPGQLEIASYNPVDIGKIEDGKTKTITVYVMWTGQTPPDDVDITIKAEVNGDNCTGQNAVVGTIPKCLTSPAPTPLDISTDSDSITFTPPPNPPPEKPDCKAPDPDPFDFRVTVALPSDSEVPPSVVEDIKINVVEAKGTAGGSIKRLTGEQTIDSLGRGADTTKTFKLKIEKPNPIGGYVSVLAKVTTPTQNGMQKGIDWIYHLVKLKKCNGNDRTDDDGDTVYINVDMGNLEACAYPTLFMNPGHWLTDIAWLGDSSNADDGVTFLDPQWMPCTERQVQVVVSGSGYGECSCMSDTFYLNAWKDGNLDLDFCDTLCNGQIPEWIIQDEPVEQGSYVFTFVDPSVPESGLYDGVFRFRLTSIPVGAEGFGLIDTIECPDMPCGTFDVDFLGEVEDYYIIPPPIDDLTITADADSVVLYWSPSDDATSYKVYRFDDPEQDPATWTLLSVQADTTYAEPLPGAAKSFYSVISVVE